MVRTLFFLAVLTAASSCIAGNASGTFTINIALNTGASPSSANGVCVSQTLSEENGATVKIACDSGQFVSISPVPGGRFVGTHGGAYGYYFTHAFQATDVAGTGEFANGAGSTAAFRVLGISESERNFDLLVSF